MGSTGTGRFRDYPKRPARKKKAGKGGSGGGPEVDDRCAQPIDSIRLENVERCTYFRNHEDVPPAGTDVELSRRLDGGRLAIVLTASRETLGHLPTRLNYLRECMQKYSYAGEVTGASTGGVARVTINLQPAE